MRRYGNSRVASDQVEEVRRIAGDGTFAERCRNILYAYGETWFGEPMTDKEYRELFRRVVQRRRINEAIRIAKNDQNQRNR